MRDETVVKSVRSAKEFIARAKEYTDREKREPLCVYQSKEGGALQRASMDLTRTLADLRQGR